MTGFVRYSNDVETIDADEAELGEKIVAVMSKGAEAVREKEGHAFRSSHAKAHALARAELTVGSGLAPELAQGLFAQARSYEVVVRLAHVPGELLDDRKVSTPRGMALKVLGVDGPMLAGSSQDWVLDTGEVFIASDAKIFLQQIMMTEAAAAKPDVLHAAVSAISRVQNAALNAVGLNSANLDFYGHPKLDPLTESYYSQTPFRYGDYVAKLRVRPLGMADHPIEIEDENGLRARVTAEMRSRATEWAVEVQLCTDLDRMPVEDAHANWSQEESPFREVARLTLPAQDAWTAASPSQEDSLSFCISHSLEAHRPLGSISRARMRVYDTMAQRRAQANGVAIREPARAEEVSA